MACSNSSWMLSPTAATADERVGVQVKLWDPLRTRAITRALLRWHFTKRHYLKCTYLYLLLVCTWAAAESVPLHHSIPAVCIITSTLTTPYFSVSWQNYTKPSRYLCVALQRRHFILPQLLCTHVTQLVHSSNLQPTPLPHKMWGHSHISHYVLPFPSNHQLSFGQIYPQSFPFQILLQDVEFTNLFLTAITAKSGHVWVSRV